MKTCDKCGNSTSDLSAKFCSKCGKQYSPEQNLPYIGERKSKGIFRIIFPPQEREFDSMDDVEELIRHSNLGEDDTFEGKAKIEFVRSTVTTETHPYECATCEQNDELENKIVAEDNKGRCTNCGKVNWQLRKD